MQAPKTAKAIQSRGGIKDILECGARYENCGGNLVCHFARSGDGSLVLVLLQTKWCTVHPAAASPAGQVSAVARQGSASARHDRETG